ncbi:dihydrofolate reductase [Thiorhodovibrio frisius]|uniref:Dihydrofolate reductase n=1 Tax=Thiorhodovibrio frisius TaxID=631362 RepID=H8Z774_9GAMM|nr:dihydrofolate reductase [Thiorhodovibrio frisius]EIC20873.1 dihydrofolate reductase [Thiorhodovibrio frisius]WPL21928.1 Dihydrofolate reductase type 3 [Thiorhodovibrio frisius]
MARVTLIAALARNFVIGRDNALPWHLPADLAHFKALTLDKPIVMGRRTFESLPGLLPRREHIVVSRERNVQPDGVILVHSPEAAIAACAGAAELMVIGGASLYRALMPQAACMYLTWVEADVDGDVDFPRWNPAHWREIASESRPADARNAYDLRFVTLERCADA